MNEIDAMVVAVKEWREAARKDIIVARDNGKQLAQLGDKYGQDHFIEECRYLSGRIDAYSDVLLLLREKRLGI